MSLNDGDPEVTNADIAAIVSLVVLLTLLMWNVIKTL